MEPVIFLIACSILVLAVLSLVLWLHRSSQQQISRGWEELRAAQSRHESESLATRTFLSEFATSSLQRTSDSLAQSQMANITALGSFVETSTRSTSSLAEKSAAMLQATITLLASKDPIAYQQAMAAQVSNPTPAAPGPYPAAGDALGWAAEQEAMREDARAQLEALGFGGMNVDLSGLPTAPVVPGVPHPGSPFVS